MKINWIAFLVVLVLVYTGCKEKPDVIPPPPKSPEFVMAVAIPATVEYNRSTTLKFKVLYADYVIVNGTKMGVEDSIKVPPLTSTTTIDIVAYGKGGTFSWPVTIVVLPAPIIPNRTDSLCSMVWYWKARETFNKNGVLLSHSILTESDTTTAYRYHKDGRTTTTPKGGIENFGGNYWKWVDRDHIMSGDQICRYMLVDNILYLYQSNIDGSEVYRRKYIGVKI